MLKNCENCGGHLHFSPKDKGNVCENCGSVFPVPYNYSFNKKTFDEHTIEPTKDELANSLRSFKCKSCGANVMLTKFQMQTVCPYCGNTSIVKSKSKNLLYIDSILPFTFGKADALKKFKSTVNKKFYANKKIFKNIKDKDISGVYVNAFVFDMSTSSRYYGVFSYVDSYRDREGNTKQRTVYKNVSGFFNKTYKNITVEANSNIEQDELRSIMPFEYGSAVEFKKEFMYGYMLEYKDKMFNSCVSTAETIIKEDIKQQLLKKHGCTKIEQLSLDIEYPDRRYNYCLLPVYFVNATVKDKRYKVVMNGQTGKVGKLPKDKLRVFLTIFFVCLLIVGIILLIMYLSK